MNGNKYIDSTDRYKMFSSSITGKKGWHISSHRYNKTGKIWKVTWQKSGYKITKRNQQIVNYEWYQLPRELMKMYTPNGMLGNEYNGPLNAIKRNNARKRKVKNAKRKLKGPSTGEKYQAEISDYEKNKLIDEKKMELIEAQMVHQAFLCKKRKKEEIMTPQQAPSTKRLSDEEEAAKFVKQCEEANVSALVYQMIQAEKGSNKYNPIDLT